MDVIYLFRMLKKNLSSESNSFVSTCLSRQDRQHSRKTNFIISLSFKETT